MLPLKLATFCLAAAVAGVTVHTSNVKGTAFDRLAIIYFENVNYEKASGDENFAWFASKGIKLTNQWAVMHPSQPNYIAAVSGDYFGNSDDGHNALPTSVFTVVDLLESKNISWAQYQEDIPSAGFEGDSYKNQQNGRNDYVRKHNPGVHFDSVTTDETRANRITTFSQTDLSKSQFHDDLRANTLPQWMFITPNMTSDGHDSGLQFAGKWCRAFLEPLLSSTNFMQNTMVLITWDEAEASSSRPNRILGVLVGDAIPAELVGTTDDNFYNHYSSIATVSANWNLPTLGRWDTGANVYQWVAAKTGDAMRKWRSAADQKDHLYATGYTGYLDQNGKNRRIPSPNLDLVRNGRPVLPAIVSAWKDKGKENPTYYSDTIEVPDGKHPPNGYGK